MKIKLDESWHGEFDQPPAELEAQAVRAARAAIMRLMGESLQKATYQSHTNMPKVGQRVRNTNKKCKHFGSEGVVTAISDLPGGAGKTISYKCTNGGDSWDKGQVLKKTPDQLSPMSKAEDPNQCGHDQLVKTLTRGGEVDVLDDLSKMMADQYKQRIERMKKDLARAVRERNEK